MSNKHHHRLIHSNARKSSFPRLQLSVVLDLRAPFRSRCCQVCRILPSETLLSLVFDGRA
ncbi:hypothetical protein CB0940_09342 [Cercospora beticola]|uniref:Uncharacterized protein n=1 Tax=Cercospora beticola TaxID=122368 RepID=A0A2G5HGX6_CERBT|nr:hypothetical protein CB0940_09342 [Cercospora beticola]PIA91790.1 hypothetical protein CB0940_09342 [Cercospora beticola]